MLNYVHKIENIETNCIIVCQLLRNQFLKILEISEPEQKLFMNHDSIHYIIVSWTSSQGLLRRLATRTNMLFVGLAALALGASDTPVPSLFGWAACS